MSRFDEVLPQTVALVERSAIFSYLEAATVVRDLKGRVRLVLRFHQDANGNDNLPPNWDAERQMLIQQLSAALGAYWGEQIWREGQRRDAAFMSVQNSILSNRRRWFDAPTTSGSPLAWYKLERQFSKSAWLLGGAAPPWTLDENDSPAIVSFYSFKGGVGRTTAVAAVALLLSRAGRRVTVLDLDLEAPGLGILLLGNIAIPEEGIVDYLIERQIRNARPANLAPYAAVLADPNLVGNQPIQVFSAGRLNIAFLEKIARLDFENFFVSGTNPLIDLLTHIRDEYQPEFILLDVRSGLHDLGGLSINGLSHLDVLFGRESSQSWAGLTTVLELLGAARPHREVILVHALVPPANVDPQAHERFLPQSYNLFRDHYFTRDEDIPNISDPEAPYGFPLAYQERLQSATSDLTSIVDTLTDPKGDYAKLVRLIGTYLERDTL